MSFYGTIQNNYPESYEPNLGRVQAIEEAFEDINEKIQTNATNIQTNTTDIANIEQSIVEIKNIYGNIKSFTITRYCEGNNTFRFDLEDASKSDVVIVQSVGFERYGEIANYYPAITKVIYKDIGISNDYSEVSIYVEIPAYYGSPQGQDNRICVQGIIIKPSVFTNT